MRVHPSWDALRPDSGVPLCAERLCAFIKTEPHTVIWRDRLPDGTDAIIKLYRRGFGCWLRSRLTGFRARREFDGLRRLEALQVPCSLPLFWSHGRFAEHGWCQMLATRWIPDSRPLSDVLKAVPEIGRRPDLTPVFHSVARMHDAGFHHGTLLSRNILLQGEPSKPTFFFIDLPHFHSFPRSIRHTRMARHDLLSLCESLRAHFPADAVRTWLSAYGMPVEDQLAFVADSERFRNAYRLRRITGAEFNLRHIFTRIKAIFA